MMTDLTKGASAPKERTAVKGKLDWQRIAVHVVGLAGLFHLGVIWLADGLTANPIQFIEQHLGRSAVNMLVLTLAVTPVSTVSGWRFLPRHRRTFGLYTFFYFLLHFLTFAVVDYGLDWGEILRLTTEKPFIIVGLLAGIILLVLAITSFKFWMKRLGRNWKRLHSAIYLAGGLVFLHYAWAVKGSLTTLSGDILRPLGIGALLAVLLVFRIPRVRRWAANLRSARRRQSVE